MTRLASAKPAPYWTTMKRSPMGEKRRASYQAEAGYAKTFEETLDLHRLDYWHVNLPMRSRAGFPDYLVMGLDWHAFVELKARNPITGRIGKLSAEQRAFHETLRRAAAEIQNFLLPDDWHEVDVWLNAHTGRAINAPR